MVYRKLKKTWSHNSLNYLPNFRKVFPELNKLTNEELCDRFIDLKLDFYYEKKTPVNIWIRLTLPFALVAILLMLLALPINFLVTGQWGYSLGKENKILNWFKSLKLQ